MARAVRPVLHGRAWLALAVLAALMTSIAVHDATAQSQRRRPVTPAQPSAQLDPRLLAGNKFAFWLDNNTERGRESLCREASEVRRSVDGTGRGFDPESAIRRLGEWKVISNYYMLVLADEACRYGVASMVELDQLPRDAFGLVQLPLEEDRIPACNPGRRPFLPGPTLRRLGSVLTNIGQLRLTVVSCLIFADIYNEVVGLRSDRVRIRDVESGQLQFRGMVAKTLMIDSTSCLRQADDGHGARKFKELSSTHLGVFVLSGSQIGTLWMDGFQATAFIFQGEILDQAELSRGVAGAIDFSDSKLKSISLSQSEVSAVNIRSSSIKDNLRLGSSPFGADRYLAVKDWIELTDVEVGGDAIISVRLGPDADEEAVQGRESDSWINLNRLSAKSLQLVGSDIRLGRTSSVHGFSVQVRERIRVAGSVIHRAIPEDGRYVIHDLEPPELQARHPPTARSQSAAIGLSQVSAPLIDVESSLIAGSFGMNGKVGTVSVITHPIADLSRPWGERCTYNRPDEVYGTSQWLVGMGPINLLRGLPAGYEQMPICYGTLFTNGGEVENVIAAASLSDLVIKNVKIKNSITVAGRYSGLVNLSQADMKDATLSLGDRAAPLTWCDGAELVMEGTRARALFADDSGLQAQHCTSAPSDGARPPPKLKLSLRGFKFEQILGWPRMKADDAVNRGLLGWNSDQLVALLSPRETARPLTARLWEMWAEHDTRHLAREGAQSATVRTPEPTTAGRVAAAPEPQPSPQFDPEALATLTALLKANGYVNTATNLTIERVSRQRWEGGRMDRLKYVLGWPISWGYELEFAFVYGACFIGMGAWVAAYYRRAPAPFPPPPTWSGAELRLGRPGRELRQAAYRLLMILGSLAMTYVVAIELPLRAKLTQEEAGVVIAGALGVAAIIGAGCTWSTLRSSFWRFALAAGAIDVHAIFFSLDRFLPAPGFHSYWGLYPRIGQGGRNYFYVHRFTGLILVSLVTAGLVGLFD